VTAGTLTARNAWRLGGHEQSTRPAGKASKKAKDGWPLVVYVWTAGLGFLGYIVIRMGLDAYPHPIHWLGGVGGALLGCGIGRLWYRLKGDIV
jgi:hypothetical protein